MSKHLEGVKPFLRELGSLSFQNIWRPPCGKLLSNVSQAYVRKAGDQETSEGAATAWAE